MNSPAKRAIVVGMDGASMEIVKHMAENGHAPNMARLMAQGVYREMLGVLPTLTPPGWTTLATGAWPGTHQVMDFNIRDLGQPLDKTRWGINTSLCKAEYLWNTAERAGKVPILVKYEISWPPTVKRGVQVEGTGPGVANYAQIAGYHLFVAGRLINYAIGGQRDSEAVDPSALQDGAVVDPVRVQPADGWSNLPASPRPPLEAVLVIKPLARGRDNMRRGSRGEPRTYFALLYASGKDYDRLRVTRSRNGADTVADLAVGQWSDWWRDGFCIDGKDIEGNVRCKLMTMSPDGDQFELFFPQIWPITGYTHPEGVAQEILDHVGPFIQNPARDVMGLIDDDTYFELLEYHLQELANIGLYLTGSRPWDLLFVETHASDYANHFFIGQADPISGAPPEVIERCYRGMARTFAAMDRMIGKLMERMDEETIFVVMSDHGGTPSQFRAVDVAEVLDQAGLLTYQRDPATGKRRIDWSRTKAAPVGIVNIFINMKGREPDGIVDPADYEEVQREIIAALFEYRDPASGRHPFALALTRRDAETVNLWGELVGDVIYALRPEFDGAHGRQLTTAKLGIGAQHATFILAGAGVRKGAHLKRQVRQVDVAPTIAYLLGMPMPRDVEGGVVYEALEDPNWPLSEIERLMQK